jgi:hypothetical protein
MGTRLVAVAFSVSALSATQSPTLAVKVLRGGKVMELTTRARARDAR